MGDGEPAPVSALYVIRLPEHLAAAVGAKTYNETYSPLLQESSTPQSLLLASPPIWRLASPVATYILCLRHLPGWALLLVLGDTSRIVKLKKTAAEAAEAAEKMSKYFTTTLNSKLREGTVDDHIEIHETPMRAPTSVQQQKTVRNLLAPSRTRPGTKRLEDRRTAAGSSATVTTVAEAKLFLSLIHI